MIVDGILSLVYGFFEFIFDLLPIPDIPEWYVTEILPVITQYVGMGVKLFSFAFPAELWHFLINFTKDMILVRVMYDILCKFHVLGRTQS